LSSGGDSSGGERVSVVTVATAVVVVTVATVVTIAQAACDSRGDSASPCLSRQLHETISTDRRCLFQPTKPIPAADSAWKGFTLLVVKKVPKLCFEIEFTK
jgi:hypothetical protein